MKIVIRYFIALFLLLNASHLSYSQATKQGSDTSSEVLSETEKRKIRKCPGRAGYC